MPLSSEALKKVIERQIEVIEAIKKEAERIRKEREKAQQKTGS